MKNLEFTVRDPKTGNYPDLHEIALREEWAAGLIWCDMDGFAIMEDGLLILMDECGNYAYCPDGRFEVIVDDEPSAPLSKERVHEVFERLRSNFNLKPSWMLVKNYSASVIMQNTMNKIIDIVNEYNKTRAEGNDGDAAACMGAIEKYLKSCHERANIELMLSDRDTSKKSNMLLFLDKLEHAILEDAKEEP